MTTQESIQKKKILMGKVVSYKMDKTPVVKVERYVRHPRYKKYMRLHKKYKVHDPEGVCKVGDKVRIRERRKISKHKAFEVVEKI